MATAKHFVGYGNSEGGKNGGEQQIAERKLLDTYCFPFEAAIHESKVKAIMNSYRSIAHANLRYRVAKDGKEAAILALKAGIDVEQPSDSCYKYLVEAVELGEIEESYIDRSVRQVLETKFKLGLFENPYEDGDFNEEISRPKDEELSQEIAEKSIVMVKNEDNILPLKKNIKIAVIGSSSGNKANFFGGY